MERTTRSLLLTPLLYHNLGGLSRGFLSFFKKLFEVPDCGWRLTLSPRTTRGLPHISWVGAYLPLTLQIIAHLPTECNRQNAQNRDFYFPKLCATFCLTNCWWCVIMEILRASPVGAPPKKPPQKWGGFRISWAVLRSWTEASSESCPRPTYTLRGAESLLPAVPPGRTLPRRCWG